MPFITTHAAADALVAAIRFDDQGLVAAIVQDEASGEVLMMAYMNEATLRQTLQTGRMTYWSRSRQAVWVKGEQSGHTQDVHDVRIDCDGDVLLFKVTQHGEAACHTGHRSCFYRKVDESGLVVQGSPLFDPEQTYGAG